MSVTGARVVAIFALFGVTMLAGFGPVFGFNLWKRKQEVNNLLSTEDERRHRKSNAKKISHLLLVFGGGVLLATCFVHMIPEIQENYQRYMNAKKNSTSISSRSSKFFYLKVLYSSQYSDSNADGDGNGDDEDEDEDSVPWVTICVCVGIFLTYFIEELVILLVGHDSHDHSHGSSSDRAKNVDGEKGYNNMSNDLQRDNVTQATSSNYRVHDEDHLLNHEGESIRTRFLRGLVIVVAFLAHAIFDGVAIGLQMTTYSIWTIFFAICLHKVVVVFAIGFELFEKTKSLILTAIHIAIFSAMSPLGIILSIIIQNGLSEDGSLTLILLNAIATGAILYIVFLEILQRDRCPGINGLVQLAALTMGFILMTLMTTLISDE